MKTEKKSSRPFWLFLGTLIVLTIVLLAIMGAEQRGQVLSYLLESIKVLPVLVAVVVLGTAFCLWQISRIPNRPTKSSGK
ncbi:hypothetical protein KKH39_01490 [Patescibacteria group bacterium]|nr:hypothetical protein [Patescibacteria group bacterium]